jgi:hypothetical protein
MRALFLLLGLTLLSGCHDAREPDREVDVAPVPVTLSADYAFPSLDEMHGDASGVRGLAVADPRFQMRDLPSAMLIRRAQASVAVDSLEVAVAALDSTARRLGGLVTGSAANTAGRLHSAVVTLRVPSDRLDEAVDGLTALGEMESVGITTDDVGEEFVDVTARLDNARRLEHRLLDVLSRRTGGIKDVLEVEQALGRVREEIERIQGRQRYLETHAATGTLEVRLHEPAPVISERLAAVLGGALAQAWRNFVWLAALAISSLGVIVPLVVLAVPAWLIWRSLARRAPLVSVRR